VKLSSCVYTAMFKTAVVNVKMSVVN